MSGYKYFEFIEKHVVVLGVGIALMVSLGGLAEITPVFMQANAVKPSGVEPYDAVRLAGKDVYVRDGCYLCHSQMIRSLRAEVERYGPYSLAHESYYDRPFQWGSKRTGPDLARLGGKYSDTWHVQHLIDPRSVMPESNMPGYPWLADTMVDGADIEKRMKVLRRLGDPYTDEDIEGAAAAVDGMTEMDVLVAYLQGLGLERDAAEKSEAGLASDSADDSTSDSP